MRKLLFVFALSFCIPFTLLAQNKTIKGNVVDENGKPTEGVTITVKGNKKELTQTDKNGNFSIVVAEKGKVDILFTSTQFKTKTITTDGTENLSVKLETQVTTQDEVVVIGYQSVKQKDLTIAATTLGSKQIKDIPVNSTAEALTGRLAGVQITTDEGAPGSPYQIKLRGGGSITQDNSPLYIVDGVELANGLDEIAPQDIESVTMLKDASATAIYGARGANGVILITTKGGKNAKGKTTVTYNGFVGFRELPKEMDVMAPQDFVEYQYERDNWTTDSSTYRKAYDSLNLGWNKAVSYKDTTPVDWQHKVFGRKAFMQTHNVSISGGDDATQYNLSLTDNEDNGLQLTSEFDRKIVNFRFDHKANDKLKFGFNARYNDQVIHGPGTSDQGSTAANSLRQVIKYHPLLTPAQQQDPTAIDPSANSLFLVDPVLLINNQYRNNPTTVFDVNGNINYTFTPYLSFKTTLGYDVNNAVQNSYNDSLTYTSINTPIYGGLPVAEIDSKTIKTINNSNVFTYTNDKGNGHFKDRNDFTIILGEETYQTETREFDIQYQGFAAGTSASKALNNPFLGHIPAGSPTLTNVPVTQLSYFSRVNYGYNKKYLFSFSVRADGSSIFSPENRWGYFPAGSAAWKISDEDFMKKIKFISSMKLRLSYGSAGNNRITPFSYLNQFGPQGPFPSTSPGTTPVGYGIGGQFQSGVAPIQLGNTNLKWETTISKNLGLDVGFFKDRLNMTVDVYKNDTKDLLVNITIPQTSGYINQFQNVGSTRNTGVELQLSGGIIQKKNFNWSATFNIAFNKNEVVQLTNGYISDYNSGWEKNYADYKLLVGSSIGQIYGLVNDGWYTTDDFTTAPNPAYVAGSTAANTKLPFIYTLKPGIVTNSISGGAPMPGSPKYKAFNGDSIISASDERVIGHTSPKFFGGLNQQFTYKGFDMSIFINFQYGNQVLNANKVEYTNGYTNDANMLALMNNRWKTIDANGNQVETNAQNSGSAVVYGVDPATLNGINKNAKIWTPSNNYAYFNPQSFAVEDGSFIRINNITLGYTLPKKLLRRFKISSLRFYGTVNNLAVLTSYSGYDPEVNTRRATPLTPGVDYSAYPRSRQFIFGLNLSL